MIGEIIHRIYKKQYQWKSFHTIDDYISDINRNKWKEIHKIKLWNGWKPINCKSSFRWDFRTKRQIYP